MSGWERRARLGSSKSDAAEAEGVGDDGDRADAHGGAGEHRVQQPAGERIENAGGEGEAEEVVGEGPEEVLLDVAEGGAGEVHGADEGRGATGGEEEIERAAAEDAVLMARVRTGDETAMGVLIGRWELPVKRVIARIVFNAGEAEELAQETMVRVWQKREQFRAGAAVRPWIFTIAVNVARNRLRWWRRRPTIALEEWSETEDGEREGRREGETRRTGDGGGLERAERAAAVQAAVAALPGELREALVLFEYEGLRQAEIAAMLGCSVKAVESRVARAKEKLRAALMPWA